MSTDHFTEPRTPGGAGYAELAAALNKTTAKLAAAVRRRFMRAGLPPDDSPDLLITVEHLQAVAWRMALDDPWREALERSIAGAANLSPRDVPGGIVRAVQALFWYFALCRLSRRGENRLVSKWANDFVELTASGSVGDAMGEDCAAGFALFFAFARRPKAWRRFLRLVEEI